jgi:hypothetical protein
MFWVRVDVHVVLIVIRGWEEEKVFGFIVRLAFWWNLKLFADYSTLLQLGTIDTT